MDQEGFGRPCWVRGAVVVSVLRETVLRNRHHSRTKGDPKRSMGENHGQRGHAEAEDGCPCAARRWTRARK